MSKQRLGPEAKIIALFTALPDDSKRIVLDVIRSQTATRPKASSTVQPAGKKSSRKGAEPSSTVSTGTAREGASSAPANNRGVRCAVDGCGLLEIAAVHHQDHDDYHIFRTSLKKSKPNGEDKAQGATA